MNEQRLQREKSEFQAKRQQLQGQAMQRAALQIIARIDLDALLIAPCEQKLAAIRRLVRLIERERLKGAMRHWSYDLNRHIALKQALDQIRNHMRDSLKPPQKH